MLAPIVLFVYNRPWHTQQTVEALLANELANESDLIIFADGARSDKDADAVKEVRKYIHSITGFKSITINEQDMNLGLANSVIAGVTKVVNKFGRIIVLEDDMVTSPYFLRYMNDALEMYEDEDKVISIHGYMYPVKEQLPETFFLRGADCWGWATWRRSWELFEPDAKKLLTEIKMSQQRKQFDFDDSFPYYKMLVYQTKGKVDSWAIRWYASAFLMNKLTLYPAWSLVKNIGLDNSGTHCSDLNTYKAELQDRKIDCKKINIVEDINSKKIISDFLMKRKKTFLCRLKEIIKKIVPQFILDLLRAKNRTVYSGNYSSWSEAEKLCSGYAQDNILQKVTVATEKVVSGEAVFERDSMLFYHEEYNWNIINPLLKAAEENNNELCVIDFGGALGSTYFQNRKQFANLNKLKWCVIEQENFVKTGREQFQNDELCFYSDIATCVKENQVTAILFSSVLQYLSNPWKILKEAMAVEAKYIVFDRIFVLNGSDEDRLCIQKVPAVIYQAAYPMWAFARSSIEKNISDSYREILEFDAISGEVILSAPCAKASDVNAH